MERNIKPFSDIKVGDTIYVSEIHQYWKNIECTDEQREFMKMARGRDTSQVLVYERTDVSEYEVIDIQPSLADGTCFTLRNKEGLYRAVNLLNKNLKTHNVSYHRSFMSSVVYCTTREELEVGIKNVLEGFILYENICMNEKVSSLSKIKYGV